MPITEHAATLLDPYFYHYAQVFFQSNFVPPRNEAPMWNSLLRQACALSGGFPEDV